MLFNKECGGIPLEITLLDNIVFKAKVSAIESLIKAYTHNSFIDRETGGVNYPPVVVDGAIKLLLWDIQSSGKVGVKSESISRHSVTYIDQNDTNTIMGYPAFLMGFLAPYIKARF